MSLGIQIGIIVAAIYCVYKVCDTVVEVARIKWYCSSSNHLDFQYEDKLDGGH